MPDADGQHDGAAGAVALQAPADLAGEGAGAHQEPGLTLFSRRVGSRSAWILAVCCVAQFMVILDLSIVNVALPSIQTALNFSSPELQWVVDAYAITFAGFLMLGGRAADRLGHRRVFVISLLLFALASLAGGLAPDREILIVARAIQGLAGAFMAAASLAIVTSSFAPGPKLHRAIAIWAAMNGLGGAAGVLFGGIITQEISWRWILLINPPIGVVTVAIAYAVVKDRRSASEGKGFDVAGALTLTLGQVVLVYGVVEAGLVGWSSAAALGPILGGLVLLGLFNVIEARFASSPLIPFQKLTRELNVANGVVVLFSAALFPMWFVSSLYLQQVLGLSPLHTGLTFLPMALVIMTVASRAGKLVSRFGVRAVLGGGLSMMTGGMLLFSRIGSSGSSITYVMIPGMLTAAGIGLSIVSSTIAATQGAERGQTGLASGLVNTSRQAGGGIGLAVLITLATQHTSHLIGTGQQVPEALTQGFRLAYLIGAGLTAAAALVAFGLVRRAAPAPGPLLRRMALVIAIPVAIGAFVAVDYSIGGTRGAPIGAYTTRGAYDFASAPGLHPPKLRINGPTAFGKLAPGYIFTANFYNLNYPPLVGQGGPLMLDSHLQPVWFRPVPINEVAGNLSLQRWQGKPALAWWQGVVTNTGATESGTYTVVDSHYRTVATLTGRNGWTLTLHGFQIVGHDAWVTAEKNIPRDLSSQGGAYNGAMIDAAAQEYDLRTGKLLRSWDALDHIHPSDSYATVPTNGFPWDAYHINAVQALGNGTFLVSMRDTWAAYLVNIRTGHIIWTLGGRHSSFKLGPKADFQWQHDVTLQPGNVVTMFDDHCCQLTSGGTYVSASAPSRGLTLKLDLRAHTATRVTDYGVDLQIDSDYMGDEQPLPNGNVMVGWGSTPYISEYTRSGTQIFGAILPGEDLTYRALVEPWVGLPLTPPAGAARTSAGRTTVYASWNGATQVASWQVLAGPSAAALAVVASAKRSGFETAIPLSRAYATFELRALNAAGRVIGTSKPFAARA